MNRRHSFAEIVEGRLKELETNPYAFAASSGISYERLRGVLRADERRADPKFEAAREIIEALGLEFYVGPPRESGPVSTTEISGDEYAAVERHDAQLSAGPGAENADHSKLGTVAFRRDWLVREGISPGDAMVVSVKGDSMAPTLCDGDLVMIDTRRRNPVGRKIYALVDADGQARVKRVERLPEALLLQSDNDDYPTELIPATDANRVRILGEVVWWSHTVRE